MNSIIRRSKRERHITFEYTGNNEEDIPNNVTHVRVLHGVTKINDRAFARRSRLESITFPSTVVEIGQEAFDNCPNLKQIVFNEGIRRLVMLHLEVANHWKVSHFHLQLLRLVLRHLKVVHNWGR